MKKWIISITDGCKYCEDYTQEMHELRTCLHKEVHNKGLTKTTRRYLIKESYNIISVNRRRLHVRKE
jgi:hypothetical protein